MNSTSFPSATENTALLFRDYYAKVRRWAVRLVGTPSDADDVVQDVFLAAYKHCQLHGELANPVPWLRQATSNISRHLWRSRGRQARRELSWDRELASQSVATPLDQVEAKFTAQRLNRAIAAVDPLHADVYVLFEIQQLPAATVATLTGIRPTTLRVRRFRARSAVAECLARLQAQDERAAAQAR